jgi:hypothetical protein
MNKRLNTVLFILGATIFNVLTVIVSFILFFLFYLRFLAPLVPEAAQNWSFSFIFVLSIVASFLAYRYILKFLTKKIDFDKYFDPLFVRKNTKK